MVRVVKTSLLGPMVCPEAFTSTKCADGIAWSGVPDEPGEVCRAHGETIDPDSGETVDPKTGETVDPNDGCTMSDYEIDQLLFCEPIKEEEEEQ